MPGSILGPYQTLEVWMIGQWMLCDFHIHTDTSDGSLPLAEVVDLYGEKRFDIICITDHIVDRVTASRNKNDKKFFVSEEEFPQYQQELWREAKRAWEKYNMVLIPGAEITNDHNEFHLLAIDLKQYIDPSSSVEAIIVEIHRQGGIAVACHPHHKSSECIHRTLYLWERYEQYAPLFDAWEVANRDDLFNVVGLKKSNYIANSDFHEIWHLYSWKTLIHADKNAEAVKQALRNNNNIAIHLFRKEKELGGANS